MTFCKKVLLSCLAMWVALPTSIAFAQSCTSISALPLVITQAGHYCLTQNLRYEGAVPVSGQLDNAITVVADDVTVDLNGYTMQGGVNASINPASAGVRGSDRKNVTIRNGAIRNFGIGVQLSDAAGGITPMGSMVERLLVDGALISGLSIAGQNAIIRDNRISNLASTSTTYMAVGIVSYGTNARVTHNAISNISSATLSASGISVDGSGSLVQDNSIFNINPGKTGYGVIATANASGSLVKGNVISNVNASMGMGVVTVQGVTNFAVDDNMVSGYSTGMNLGGPTNKFKNNIVNGATTIPYNGGTNIGGNN
jgi:hypothetical protein